MAFDATKLADWQISEEAEKDMPTPEEWRERLGLHKDEMLPMGRLSKIDFLRVINRLKDKSDEVHRGDGHTPTPLRREKHHLMRFDGGAWQARR